MKIRIYDPPSGWRYGFPKQYSPLPDEELSETLIRDGYPKHLLVDAIHHTRFWTYDDDDGEG